MFIAIFAVTAVDAAHAWFPDFCDTSYMRWPDGYFQTVRNTCSIPPGSAQDAAYDNAITQMNKAVHVVSKFGDDDPSKCEVEWPDGYKQVALVKRSYIDGKNGRTHIISTCAWPLETAYNEIDMMIADDLPDFSNPPDEAISEQSGQSVFLHEMGHAHGLNHDPDSLNVMGDARTFPLAGGTGAHAVLFPDDAAGLRTIYPEPDRLSSRLTCSPRPISYAPATNKLSSTLPRRH
jgi:hypothetical protein